MSDMVVKEKTTVAKATEAGELLAVIAKAVSDPNIDVEKMERLLAMHERIVDRNAKVAFADALARIQAKLKPIQQSAVIMAKNKIDVRSRYAPLEDIDEILRPMMAEDGFALSFDVKETPSGKLELLGKLSHRDGHSEVKAIPLPIDKNEYRTAIQDHASTISFGKRIITKNHFNIIERYEDKDGQSLEQISDDQARDLEILLEETKSDKGGFLRFMGVEKLGEIRQKDLKKAMTAIEAKKRGRK